MKWTYSIKNKIIASVLLFLILVTVLINNISGRYDNEQFEKNIKTIYDDRLMVENYIFQLTDNLYKFIEELNSSSQVTTTAMHRIVDVRNINSMYAKTILTPQEKLYFDRFVKLSDKMYNELNSNSKEKIIADAKESINVLHKLSEIQITEAQLALKQSQRLLKSSLNSAQLEMVLLIFVGLVIQALIFANNTIKTSPKQNKDFNLN